MRIAVIDNYDSFVFNLVRYIREIEGVQTHIFRNDAIDFDTVSQCDGILLSPGPGIPNEAGALMQVLEKYADSKSILGVCLGHQAIASHYGGRLAQCDQPIHGKASMARQFNNCPLFVGLPENFEVGRYHSWAVANDLPENLISSASCDDGIMAIRHKTLPVFGVQFHPESILTPNGRQIVENWIHLIKTNKNLRS